MMVMVLIAMTGERGTILKCILKGLEDLEIRGRVETVQTTTDL